MVAEKVTREIMAMMAAESAVAGGSGRHNAMVAGGWWADGWWLGVLEVRQR
ncbi:hypothetical protein WN943_010427 [Citrus x changshan-huyou]